jgi:hypothetical protein
MTTLSVYTPSHSPRFLDEAWASLRGQTFTDWEWLVVLNGGARWTPPTDPRVRVITCDELRGVGAAKHRACAEASGEILVEFDHDDLLTTNALEEVVRAFDAHPEVGFCYSDGAQILEDGSKDPSRWDQANGWVYRDEIVEVAGIDGDVQKREVLAVQALEPSPGNAARIWWLPNHIRAFRRSVYEQVGGYDMTLDVLDDQDLLSRLYEVTDFWHIHETLYLQRCHAGMTQKQTETNALIQTRTVELGDKYVERMALAWAKRNGLLALDLGGGHNSPPGYLSVDTVEGVDLRGDLFEILGAMPESSVGVIRAVDLLEHVDKIAIANLCHRVLAPDGMILSCTPSALGQGAFMDPTHTSFYVEASFFYWCDRNYQKYVPELTARFQQSRLLTYFPSQWHIENNVPYVQFNGICIKPGGVKNGGYDRWQ